MNGKRYLLASIAVIIFLFIWSWLWNGIVLSSCYQATADVWRTQQAMTMNMGWMIVGYILFALIFCFIYARRYRNSTVKSGVAYGFGLSLLFGATMFGWYVVLPIPGLLAVWWFVGGIIELSFAGLLVGAIYKT